MPDINPDDLFAVPQLDYDGPGHSGDGVPMDAPEQAGEDK